MMIIFGHSHFHWSQIQEPLGFIGKWAPRYRPGLWNVWVTSFRKVCPQPQHGVTHLQTDCINITGEISTYLFVLLSDKWTWDTGEEVKKIVRMAGT